MSVQVEQMYLHLSEVTADKHVSLRRYDSYLFLDIRISDSLFCSFLGSFFTLIRILLVGCVIILKLHYEVVYALASLKIGIGQYLYSGYS